MDETTRSLILGLGNTALRDDGAGIHACRIAAGLLPENAPVDILEAEIGGFSLIELLEGYPRVVVIDAVVLPDLEPGEVVTLDGFALQPSAHLVGGHEIDMPTALELGRRLGMSMPVELLVVGIQAQDLCTADESPSPAVRASLRAAAETAVSLATA